MYICVYIYIHIPIYILFLYPYMCTLLCYILHYCDSSYGYISINKINKKILIVCLAVKPDHFCGEATAKMMIMKFLK